jgi:molecular chaperone GrpE
MSRKKVTEENQKQEVTQNSRQETQDNKAEQKTKSARQQEQEVKDENTKVEAEKVEDSEGQEAKKNAREEQEKQNVEQKTQNKKTEQESKSADQKEVEAKSRKESEGKEAKEEAKEAARDETELLRQQLKELNDKYLRLVAEYDNFRKRTLKEKMELSKSAGESILLGLLPVIDDFDRARAHLGTASDLDAVKEGIDLIYNKFKEFLKQQGVTEIETEEQEFDSELHDAVTKITAPSEDKKGKIIDCIQKGYKLNDKIIRFPKVVVGE